MIPFFPKLYPDELLYSLFARYYIKTGYTAYIFAAQDLFINPKDNPNIEFINKLNNNIINIITSDISFENIILNHTMFPYYSKFLPYERKIKAYQSFLNMDGNYYNLLPIPKRKNNALRYLRYCPLCATRDKEIYGETYWHRIHQLTGVNICTVHNCYLVNSNIPIIRKSSPMLLTAEEMTTQQTPICCTNNIEIEVSKYLVSVFQSDFNFNNQVGVGQFLHNQMDNTIYKSVRGKQRNISLLHKDFADYYHSLPNNWFTELWQIQKILTNDKTNFYEICLLANFLKIPIDKLNTMELPKKTQQKLFDEKIYQLQEQGLTYPQIAECLSASINTVKAIGEKRYGTYHKQPKKPLKSGAKPKDWKQMDIELLPAVKKAIKQLQGDGITRPKRITVFAIEQILDLRPKQIDNLPSCKAKIKKHYMSQQQYWALEIVWATNTVIREGQPLNWKHIRELTNMRKRDLITCLPYLEQYKEYEWECDGNFMDIVEMVHLII